MNETTDRNRIIVAVAKQLGYPLANIRAGLHKMAGIDHTETKRRMAEAGIKTTRQNVSHTVNGIRHNHIIQSGIADVLEVPVDELFTVNGKNGASFELQKWAKGILHNG